MLLSPQECPLTRLSSVNYIHWRLLEKKIGKTVINKSPLQIWAVANSRKLYVSDWIREFILFNFIIRQLVLKIESMQIRALAKVQSSSQNACWIGFARRFLPTWSPAPLSSPPKEFPAHMCQVFWESVLDHSTICKWQRQPFKHIRAYLLLPSPYLVLLNAINAQLRSIFHLKCIK